MSGESSSKNPYNHKYPPKDGRRRIIYKKEKKKAVPIVLPKWTPTDPVKVIPLPPIRNYRGGRNKSSLLWYKCDNCDDHFPVRTGRKKKSEYAFCGKRCQAAFHSQRLKGHEISAQTRKKISDTKRGIGPKDEPQTKDGKTWRDFTSNPKNPGWYQEAKDLAAAYRSTGDWRRKSKEIQKRNNHTCQGCGFHRDEVPLMGVHHVKKLADWIYEGNDPSNYPDQLLTTLCHNCHTPTDFQKEECKWPVSSRGDETRPGYPK